MNFQPPRGGFFLSAIQRVRYNLPALKMWIKKIIIVVLAALVGSVGAYFAVSLFTFFYPGLFSFVLFGLALPFALITSALILAGEIVEAGRTKWRAEMVGILVLLLAGGLAFAVLRLCLQFPILFNRRILFMDAADLPLFVGLAILSAAAGVILQAHLNKRGMLERLRKTRIFEMIRGNWSGLFLASLFFLVYFSLAETVNFPGHRTLDQYFDMDISAWISRLQAASPRAITDEVRAVHPAVLLFLRPSVWLASLVLNGERLHAVFMVHALAAAACVFLAWKIVIRASSNTSYALIAASILGASASHLLLGSMMETYIYSALALLIFVSLLQNEVISFKSMALAGILVFGITVTNLAQTVILYFSKQSNFKMLLRYFIIVAAAVFILNWIQVWTYPAARAMTPSNLQGEQSYRVNLTKKPWHLTGRLSLMGRAILFYGVVAPKPFILMEELGMNVPNFRTFQIAIGEFRVAGYSGLADAAVIIWVAILVGAFVLFVLDWFGKVKPVFALGLLICLGFNFVLHVLYGDDPLLYSPDWVYALVLFVMFSFSRFADRKWFQAFAAVFLALAMTINFGLLRQIMEVSAPFYGR